MAAAFFNQLADPAKARARSAGTDPSDRVNPTVVEALCEIGIDLGDPRPRLLTPALGSGAQWLITMGCGDECPAVPGAKRDDWPLDDPAGRPLADVRRIRDIVRTRVLDFVRANGWERGIT